MKGMSTFPKARLWIAPAVFALVPVSSHMTNTVPAVKAMFSEMDIRYRSTFITKAAKQRNSTMMIDAHIPKKIPNQTLLNIALKITPASADVSIILSPAMFNKPAWEDSVEQIATNMIGVEIRITE